MYAQVSAYFQPLNAKLSLALFGLPLLGFI